MKKKATLKTNKAAGAPETAEVARLDETISGLAKSTRTTVEKYWKIGAAVLVVICGGFGVIHVMNAMAEGREENSFAELYALTGSAEALDSDAVLDSIRNRSARIRALVDKVRGTEGERYVLRKSVEYLLGQLSGLRRKEAAPPQIQISSPGSNILGASGDILGAAGEGAADAAEDAKLNTETRKDIVELVQYIVATGNERFPDDDDTKSWGASVEGKIASDRDKASWLPHEREYSLQLPSVLTGDAPNPAPSDGTGSDGAGSDSDDGTGSEGARKSPPSGPQSSVDPVRRTSDRSDHTETQSPPGDSRKLASGTGVATDSSIAA